MDRHTQRRITLVERSAIPTLDILFAFGPIVPFVAGAILAWWLTGPRAFLVLQATALWGCAILLFLSGVRRGLSFRTEGGPTLAQLATMLMLYGLGLSALAAAWLDALAQAFGLLLAGYVAIVVLDPIAARRGEAPLYFDRLRRLQMPFAILSLASALVRLGFPSA